jgi:sugar/nucleoside kinase (ribokinase family)
VEVVRDGDPTGCGDVWGITTFLGIIEGLEIEVAIRRANLAAGANVSYRGTAGLNRYLKGKLAVG